jgi:hypothetical protein
MARATRTSGALVFVQTLMLSTPGEAATDAEPPADDFWTRKTLLGDGGGRHPQPRGAGAEDRQRGDPRAPHGHHFLKTETAPRISVPSRLLF